MSQQHKMRGACYQCGHTFPIDELKRFPSVLGHRYCPRCCIQCPVCHGWHLAHRYEWLYPLCDTCQSMLSLERERVDIELAKIKRHLKRAEQLNRPATLRLGEWLATLEYFEWKCAYCDGSYDLLEHFIPLTLSGGTTQSNCIPACLRCNQIKSKLHPKRVVTIPKEAIERVHLYLQQF